MPTCWEYRAGVFASKSNYFIFHDKLFLLKNGSRNVGGPATIPGVDTVGHTSSEEYPSSTSLSGAGRRILSSN
jgi:hypothetical protein